MPNKWPQAGVISIVLLAAACAPKPVPPPPAPPVPENTIALLPEAEGASNAIVVRNQAGTQELTEAYQAVRVARSDASPSAPFTLTQADVTRLFGAAIGVMPDAEVQFVLHFDEGRDVLNAESDALIPAILNAIRERRSTAITVTGHTDTTATAQFNYDLGLRRANRVADILRGQGVNNSDLFVSSHGDADLLVPTARGIANAANRRVEVIVR
jgi:peptidoglycan-associated lipoprotein